MPSKSVMRTKISISPKIAYENIGLSASANKMDMSVIALNYAAAAQQITEFEALEQISNVTFGGISVDSETGNVKFTISLEFKPPLVRVR